MECTLKESNYYDYCPFHNVSDGALFKKCRKREGFDSLALLNDKGSALNPFKDESNLCALKHCAFYQIQKLHAVVIHELIVLTPKIIVQQRNLITVILPLFLDFPLPYEAHSCGLTKIRRKVRDYSLLKQFLKKAT